MSSTLHVRRQTGYYHGWWRSKLNWLVEVRRGRLSRPVVNYRGSGGVYEMGLQYLRKPVESELAGPKPGTIPPAPTGFGKLPALWEFLSVSFWDDGSPREPGTILVWFDGKGINGMLRDRDSKCVAFASAEDLAGILAAFDRGIRNGSLEWKPERAGRRKRG